MSPERLQNHTNDSPLDRYNSRSASTQCVAENQNFLGYKSLPSSIQHGLSEKILHNLSDKLEKLLPSGHANHHGLRVSNTGYKVDKKENVQRSRTGSLGITLSPSHNISPNGRNVISQVGQAMDKSQCLQSTSPEKHSLASPGHDTGCHDASSHCTCGKGKSLVCSK